MLAPLAKMRNLAVERGATAVEYGLLVALIAAVIVAAVVIFGQQVLQLFNAAPAF